MVKTTPKTPVELVFEILKKEFLIDKSELSGELRDHLTIISLLERYSTFEVARIIADEFNISNIG